LPYGGGGITIAKLDTSTVHIDV